MPHIPKLHFNSKTSHYVQLYEHIKQEIAHGNLPEQTRLASIRNFADPASASWPGCGWTPEPAALIETPAMCFL
ncbi:hypothetical protein [Paenibacillus sp. FJAT-26967]|uniref:hypothetical protein n=1 Tax=Paenibacillus sp. FJAT-26967 TaxID=1729690 RepID=UPI000839818F|nr:hypothetical protein [Paenibacillus sp. FJAT-26967]